MDTELAGKCVLVTGGTANIGRAIVRSFAAEKARIIVSGRDEALGAQVLAEAVTLGAQEAIWIGADLLDAGSTARLATEAVARTGGVDVLVNNSGGNAAIAPFEQSEEADWRYDIEINLIATLRLTRALLPHMIGRGSGRIINIASTAGLIGDPYLASYSAAKAGVIGFTQVLACEMGRHDITVNAIAPYATRPSNPAETRSSGSRTHPGKGIFTNLSDEQKGLIGLIYRKGVLPRTTALSDEIGGAAVYFASRQGAFLTGQTLAVDGGVGLAWRHPDTPQ